MIILIIIILALINIYLLNKNTENYDHHTDCTSCKNKGYHQCRNCVNCGACTTATGEMYCVNGDINGPYNRTDCLKWDYGNIYPQYQPNYYHKNPEHIEISTDARFYPYFKKLDDTTGSQYFNKEFLNNFYKNFNNTLKGHLYKR
jgi:hypothetical protein